MFPVIKQRATVYLDVNQDLLESFVIKVLPTVKYIKDAYNLSGVISMDFYLKLPLDVNYFPSQCPIPRGASRYRYLISFTFIYRQVTN